MPDERVDTAIGDERLALPDQREQFLAREHDTGARNELIEQLELVGCEADVGVAYANGVPCWIESHGVDLDLAPWRRAGFGMRAVHPARERGNPRGQLANT